MLTNPSFKERVRDALAQGLPMPRIQGGDGSTDEQEKAAAEKAAAEKAAADKAAEDKRLADEKAAADKKAEAELGDAGKRALEAERRARKEADDARKKAEDELAEIRKGQMSESEKAIEEARTAGRDEATSAANERVIRSEVRAAAAGKLEDPADAVKFLDLGKFKVGDDGNVDEAAITSAIDELVKDKPYLAARRGPGGTADGGPRKTGDDVDPSEMSMDQYVKWRREQDS